MSAVTNDTAALCGGVVSSRTLETHTAGPRPNNGSGAESMSGVMVSELRLGWVQQHGMGFIEVPAGFLCGQP